jgi:secondary thiamine-phosphate synthase enzyme
MAPQHPHQHSSVSPLTSFLIAFFFLLALFPSLFVSVFWAPYNTLTSYLFPAAAVAAPRSVYCRSPNICVANTMSWFQKQFTLPSRSRGSYLITDVITRELPELREYKTGLLTLFIQHTSCALSLNENYDDDVRADMSDALDRIVPEDKKGTGLYRHDAEGSDDMPMCRLMSSLRLLAPV